MVQLDVLVVDDEVEAAHAHANVLRARHSVRIAAGLREAVREVARKVPNVIVCAYNMPPFRGDALLAMIAREHPGARRVLVDAAARFIEPLSGMPAHAVLRKPVSPTALLAAVHHSE